MARQKRYNGYLRKTFTYNGKRIYIYGRTAQELLENEIRKKQELEEGKRDLYNPTVSAYYEHFYNIRRREIKESTLRAQRYQFNNIAEVKMANGISFGEMRIKEVTRRDIEKAREILWKGGKTPQNLNICFAHLNHVFNSAMLDDTIEKNPCKALKQLKRDIPLAAENKHRALTEEETRKFFEMAKERNSYYLNNFLLMIKSGMRDIPLTEELYRIIREQESVNRMFFGLEINGLLFKSAEGKILREYSINREIKRICEAAGIEPFTCHAFRNTFATRFIEQRPQDYKILSEILGHKDISITLNLYTHVMTENKVIAMDEVRIKTG